MENARMDSHRVKPGLFRRAWRVYECAACGWRWWANIDTSPTGIPTEVHNHMLGHKEAGR